MIPQTSLSTQRVVHRLMVPPRLAQMLVALANKEVVAVADLAERFGDPGYRATIMRLRKAGWFVGTRHGVGYYLRTGDRELVHEAALLGDLDITIPGATASSDPSEVNHAV